MSACRFIMVCSSTNYNCLLHGMEFGDSNFCIGSIGASGSKRSSKAPPSWAVGQTQCRYQLVGHGTLLQRSTRDGPWSDTRNILPALLEAALRDFPNPPAGPPIRFWKTKSSSPPSAPKARAGKTSTRSPARFTCATTSPHQACPTPSRNACWL